MLFLLHFHFSLHTQRTPRWTYSTVLPLMHSTYVLRALLCDCSTACREEGFLQVNSMHSSLQTGLCESTKTLQPLLQLSWWLNKVSFCLTVHPRWIQPLWKYSQNNPQLNHFSLAPGLPHFQISFSLNLTSLSSVHLHWQPATILTHPSAQLPLPKPLLLSTISPCQELPERNHHFLHLHFNDKLLSLTASHQNTAHTKHASLPQKGLLFWDRDAQRWEQTISQLKWLWCQTEELKCFCWVCRQSQCPGLLVQSLKIQWRWPQPCIHFKHRMTQVCKNSTCGLLQKDNQGSLLSLKYHVQRTFDQYYL